MFLYLYAHKNEPIRWAARFDEHPIPLMEYDRERKHRPKRDRRRPKKALFPVGDGVRTEILIGSASAKDVLPV